MIWRVIRACIPSRGLAHINIVNVWDLIFFRFDFNYGVIFWGIRFSFQTLFDITLLVFNSYWGVLTRLLVHNGTRARHRICLMQHSFCICRCKFPYLLRLTIKSVNLLFSRLLQFEMTFASLKMLSKIFSTVLLVLLQLYVLDVAEFKLINCLLFRRQLFLVMWFAVLQTLMI